MLGRGVGDDGGCTWRAKWQGGVEAAEAGGGVCFCAQKRVQKNKEATLETEAKMDVENEGEAEEDGSPARPKAKQPRKKKEPPLATEVGMVPGIEGEGAEGSAPCGSVVAVVAVKKKRRPPGKKKRDELMEAEGGGAVAGGAAEAAEEEEDERGDGGAWEEGEEEDAKVHAGIMLLRASGCFVCGFASFLVSLGAGSSFTACSRNVHISNGMFAGTVNGSTSRVNPACLAWNAPAAR